MSTETSPFRFKVEPPALVLAEISLLEREGYFVHREWANGVELRKASRVGYFGMTVRCLLSVAIPVIFLPFFGRTIVDKIFGFKYRVFVARELSNPQMRLC
jgi:hypothetical protein